jgi:hypothetical protein
VPYTLVLTPEAEHHLSRFPLPVQKFIVRELDILGKYPTSLSTRSYFPYRERCQLFRIACLYLEERWEMFALFQYGQDEQTIYVIGICFSKMPDLDDFNDEFHSIP